MLQELVAIRGQAEEMILLFNPLDGPMQRALPLDEILVLLEGLAADAVPAFVKAFVDVSGGSDTPHELLHGLLVTRLGGTNEVVVRHLEVIPDGPELVLHEIAVRERVKALLARATEHVLRMLVVAHDEQRVAARQPLIASDRVGRDFFVRGAEVGTAVHIVDRRRHVEPGHPNNSIGFAWSSNLRLSTHVLTRGARSAQTFLGLRTRLFSASSASCA